MNHFYAREQCILKQFPLRTEVFKNFFDIFKNRMSSKHTQDLRLNDFAAKETIQSWNFEEKSRRNGDRFTQVFFKPLPRAGQQHITIEFTLNTANFKSPNYFMWLALFLYDDKLKTFLSISI